MRDSVTLEYTPSGDKRLYERLAAEARELAKTDVRHAQYWREMEEKAKRLAGQTIKRQMLTAQ